MSIAEHVLILETRYRIFKRVRKKLEHASREKFEEIIRGYDAMPWYKKFLDTLSAGFGCGISEKGLEYQISKFTIDNNLGDEERRRHWAGTEKYFRKPLERYILIDD